MYGVHGTGEWGEQKGNTEEENGHIGGWIEVGVATWGTVLSMRKSVNKFIQGSIAIHSFIHSTTVIVVVVDVVSSE